MLRIISQRMAVVGSCQKTAPVFVARSFSGVKDVKINTVKNTKSADKCDTDPKKKTDDDDLEELEEMFIQGPAGMEWGGPTRGGRRPEPTRFGDWERKGRATDFK